MDTIFKTLLPGEVLTGIRALADYLSLVVLWAYLIPTSISGAVAGENGSQREL